jgi:predicted helicase
MLFNYLWIGLLRLALPEAKIVHCTRDPVDIGLSIWQLLFTPDIPWAYDLSEIGRCCQAYRKVMTHWNSIFPGEIYEANYEAMVTDQEGETRKLLDFCGLPWDDRCMRFHENKRHVRTASSAQVRVPIYTDSVKKWKKYEKYLTPLIEEVNGEAAA